MPASRKELEARVEAMEPSVLGRTEALTGLWEQRPIDERVANLEARIHEQESNLYRVLNGNPDDPLSHGFIHRLARLEADTGADPSREPARGALVRTVEAVNERLESAIKLSMEENVPKQAELERRVEALGPDEGGKVFTAKEASDQMKAGWSGDLADEAISRLEDAVEQHRSEDAQQDVDEDNILFTTRHGIEVEVMADGICFGIDGDGEDIEPSVTRGIFAELTDDHRLALLRALVPGDVSEMSEIEKVGYLQQAINSDRRAERAEALVRELEEEVGRANDRAESLHADNQVLRRRILGSEL